MILQKLEPNLFLTRTMFFETFTVGKLWRWRRDDEVSDREVLDNRLVLAYTLEPRWRDLKYGERKMVGRTAVPAGEYRLALEYDAYRSIQAPRLKGLQGFTRVFLTIARKGCQVPSLTKGDILLGEAWNGEKFCLANGAEAFRKVRDEVLLREQLRKKTVLKIFESNPDCFWRLPAEHTPQDEEEEDFDALVPE